MDYDKLIEMKPKCIGCPHIHPDNGNCTAVGGFCTAVPAAHCPLIPELRAALASVTAERDAAIERLREWEKFDTYLLIHNFMTPEKWRGPQED